MCYCWTQIFSIKDKQFTKWLNEENAQVAENIITVIPTSKLAVRGEPCIGHNISTKITDIVNPVATVKLQKWHLVNGTNLCDSRVK